ncbi:MAP kinase kinase, partial [Reticulomyxa filosa]
MKFKMNYISNNQNENKFFSSTQKQYICKSRQTATTNLKQYVQQNSAVAVHKTRKKTSGAIILPDKGIKIKQGVQKLSGGSFNTNESNNDGNRSDILKDVSELKELGNLGMFVARSLIMLISFINIFFFFWLLQVKKALHKPTNQILAVKCINFNEKNKRKQFCDELMLFLNFKHPNIVSFRGTCVDAKNGQVLIGLEFMTNGSLEDLIKQYNKIAESAAKSICKDLVEALYYLEQSKLIHRDIKPANILLDQNCTAKLADFGIAKSLESTHGTIMAKTQIGTMVYMSPERMMGEEFSFSFRFSLFYSNSQTKIIFFFFFFFGISLQLSKRYL